MHLFSSSILVIADSLSLALIVTCAAALSIKFIDQSKVWRNITTVVLFLFGTWSAVLLWKDFWQIIFPLSINKPASVEALAAVASVVVTAASAVGAIFGIMYQLKKNRELSIDESQRLEENKLIEESLRRLEIALVNLRESALATVKEASILISLCELPVNETPLDWREVIERDCRKTLALYSEFERCWKEVMTVALQYSSLWSKELNEEISIIYYVAMRLSEQSLTMLSVILLTLHPEKYELEQQQEEFDRKSFVRRFTAIHDEAFKLAGQIMNSHKRLSRELIAKRTGRKAEEDTVEAAPYLYNRELFDNEPEISEVKFEVISESEEEEKP